MDLVRMLETDSRVQVVFTQVPDQLGDGVDLWLRHLGAKVFPWEDIPKETFDLALAASLHEVGVLRARRMVVPHGAGFIKLWPTWALKGRDDSRLTYGLDDLSLLDKHGELVPDVLVLPHVDNLEIVRRQCPEALPVAVVAGDPCYDSLLVTMRHREAYRRHVGVRSGQKLIAIVSTWGSRSLFGSRPDLYTSLLSTVPADHRVIAVVHPAVWAEHGARQVLSWLRKARSMGLDVLVPGSEWRGLVVSADWLIGDHSSLSVYGAAIGVPLTIAQYPEDEVDGESVMAQLAAISPRLSPDSSPSAQFVAAAAAQPEQQRVATRGLSSMPGRSMLMLRKIMYHLMDLSEPIEPPEPHGVFLEARPSLVADNDMYS